MADAPGTPGTLRGAHDVRGVRGLFFAYFAFVGLFSPYLGLWLDARGLSIGEIALLTALPQALRIVAPPFWGWLADRSGLRVRWLRWAALGAFGVLLLFPLATRPLEYAVLLLALSFLTAAQGPIGEAIALDVAGGDAGRYGRMRLWGSVGFVLTVVAAGPMLEVFGIASLPWLMAATIALLAAMSAGMRERAPSRVARATAPVRERLREPAVIAFLASALCMVFAHAALYGFYSLFLERLGYGPTAIGLLWGVGVVAEIALFAGQRRLFALASPMRLLAASFAVAALRFAMIGASDGSAWLLVAAQLMHAVTFGLHHGASMAVMHRWFDPAQQARAQAAFIVVAYGIGGSLGALAAGALWSGVGPEAAFHGAAIAALAGGGLMALAMRPGRGAAPHGPG